MNKKMAKDVTFEPPSAIFFCRVGISFAVYGFTSTLDS